MNKLYIIAILIICFVRIKSSSPANQSVINFAQQEEFIRQRRASVVSTSSTVTVVGKQTPTKQTAPAYTYPVWDDNGIICILAQFEASFQITYDTQSGPQQKKGTVPLDATSKGRCDPYLDKNPVLDVYWIGGFILRFIFEKRGDNDWGLNSIDFIYNTADSSFVGSKKGERKVAVSAEGSLKAFNAQFGKSYFCPSPPVLNLVEPKTGRQTVVLRLAKIQIQAFQIEKGKFGTPNRCSNILFGSGVSSPPGLSFVSFEQDDGVPFVVCSITITVSILTVVGYAVYKSWLVKRVDYDTMG